MGKTFLEQCRNPALRIDNVLDMQSQEIKKSNLLAVKRIAECIVFCGKQGISFCGHRDETTRQILVRIKEIFGFVGIQSQDRCNTSELHYIASTKFYHAPKNACYTSKTIQNDMIELCGNYVRVYTNATVMKGGYFYHYCR